MALGRRKSAASLPLQMLIYFNIWFDLLYFAITGVFFAYKGYEFYYASSYFVTEIAFLALFCLAEVLRLFVGHNANKKEDSSSTIMFLFLTCLSVIGAVYFLILQVYVLYVDMVINAMWLFFAAGELIFGIFCAYAFYTESWLLM